MWERKHFRTRVQDHLADLLNVTSTIFSGPKPGINHSLLIPMLVYTRKIVASGFVSDIAFSRSYALPAVCTVGGVMQNAFGFSERR